MLVTIDCLLCIMYVIHVRVVSVSDAMLINVASNARENNYASAASALQVRLPLARCLASDTDMPIFN